MAWVRLKTDGQNNFGSIEQQQRNKIQVSSPITDNRLCNLEHFIVGAIDFGTSYSGYAFSSKDRPTDIVNRKWEASSRALVSEKTPTCILFDGNKNFQAFGYEAKDGYAEYCESQLQTECYFFENYKMALFDKMVIKKDTMVTDVCGRALPLLKVIRETLKYLKEELVKHARDTVCGLTDRDFLFVLTVPAIWSDSAKGFMRTSAEQAGIPSDQLLICLEPEAAAIYCKSGSYQSQMKLSISQRRKLDAGNKYILIDAGGGTVDIIAQEVGVNGELHEIVPASGGDWGGSTVDKEFLSCLKKVYGQDPLNKFQTTKTMDYYDLMREFEVTKRSVQRQTNVSKPILLRVPISLNELYQIYETRTLDRKKDFSFSWDRWCVYQEGDKMHLNRDRFNEFFKDSLHHLEQHLNELFKKENAKNISTIILVGGYSESEHLKNFIKTKFSSKSVIVPYGPGLAILNGAVMFGHAPFLIAERRCRVSYGFKCNDLFDENKHKESSKFIDEDGELRARDSFDVHVRLGQNVKTGVYQPGISYTPLWNEQNTMQFPLYASLRKDPVHTTDEDCKEIGKIKVDISTLRGSKCDKSIRIALCFGETEIGVKAVKEQTKEELHTVLKYM